MRRRGWSNKRTMGTAVAPAETTQPPELDIRPPARSLNSVAMGHGSTKLTWTPRGPSSRRIASLSPATAILVGL